MTYRMFEVPDYDDFVAALGVAPTAVGKEQVQRLSFEKEAETLVVTLDPLGQSIHCRWSREGEILADVFREGAVEVGFNSSESHTSLILYFKTDCQHGTLEVQLSPVFSLRDQLLFH